MHIFALILFYAIGLASLHVMITTLCPSFRYTVISKTLILGYKMARHYIHHLKAADFLTVKKQHPTAF